MFGGSRCQAFLHGRWCGPTGVFGGGLVRALVPGLVHQTTPNRSTNRAPRTHQVRCKTPGNRLFFPNRLQETTGVRRISEVVRAHQGAFFGVFGAATGAGRSEGSTSAASSRARSSMWGPPASTARASRSGSAPSTTSARASAKASARGSRAAVAASSFAASASQPTAGQFAALTLCSHSRLGEFPSLTPYSA